MPRNGPLESQVMKDRHQSDIRLPELITTLVEALSSPPFALSGIVLEEESNIMTERRLREILNGLDPTDRMSMSVAISVGGVVLRRLKEWADDAVYGGNSLPYDSLTSKLRHLGALDACLHEGHYAIRRHYDQHRL